MSPYVVVVDFRLKPGTRAAFRRLIDINARQSVRDEAGCRRFDVLETSGDDDRILLYEIYDDRAAFAVHLESPHYALFDAESGDLVAGKSVIECSLVLEGSG